MNAKKCLALLLSACMAASVLAGCKDGGKKAPSSSSSGSNTTGSITWIDPDYEEDKDDDKGNGGASHKPGVSNYNIKVEGLDGNATISPNPIKVDKHGTAKFTITAKDGYYIQSVRIGNVELVPSEDRQVTAYDVTMYHVCGHRTITVTLAPLTYGIVATTWGDPSSKITWEGKDFKAGDEVTLNLHHDAVYALTKLTVNDKEVSLSDVEDDKYVLTITGDMTVEATFAKETFNVTTTVSGDKTANITPASPNVENGEKVTFTLTHGSGYELASFQVNGTEMKDQVKDDRITLTITKDTHIEVEFALITIKSTELVGNLVKKNYVDGEEFDPSGLTLVYTWSNGQVERIGLEKGAIETVKMDDAHILNTAYGKAIQIKHKEFYPEHPATAYFTTLGITIGAVDKNGNGESKYLTQADFDEIKDYLEEKADRDRWSAAGEKDTIKASLKNDQTISGYEVLKKWSYISKEYVQSKDGVMKLIDEICYYDGALTQAINKANPDNQANPRKVEVYMNITNDAVTVWFVAAKK